MAQNATIAYNHSDSQTVNALVSGDGNLVKTGAGILSLTQQNTYGGSTTIAGGTLKLAPIGAIANGLVGYWTLNGNANNSSPVATHAPGTLGGGELGPGGSHSRPAQPAVHHRGGNQRHRPRRDHGRD